MPSVPIADRASGIRHVFLRDLVMSASIGVYPHEHTTPQRVRMRTWERGSGITQACGTGASAVCVAGVLCGRTGERIRAELPGGELELEWAGQGPVFMTGPAEEVFEGVWRED